MVKNKLMAKLFVSGMDLPADILNYILFVLVVSMGFIVLSAPALQNQAGKAGQQGLLNFASLTIPNLAPDAIGIIIGIFVVVALAVGAFLATRRE